MASYVGTLRHWIRLCIAEFIPTVLNSHGGEKIKRGNSAIQISSGSF